MGNVHLLGDGDLGLLPGDANDADADADPLRLGVLGQSLALRSLVRLGRRLVIVSWEEFAASITEAQKLAQPEDFDFLYRIGEGYATVRRYAPELLSALALHAAPAAKAVLDAIELLREMNSGNARKLPDDAPLGFIRERWFRLIFTDAGIDRRYYELCALSELKNALRSGDIWVEGSRQFKNFNEYLVPAQKFAALKEAEELPLAIDSNCERYLQTRLDALHAQLKLVDELAAANDLPDVVITDSGLKITPLDASVPQAAQNLIDRVAASLPHVKITELLLEVDQWTGFTRHFTHLKNGEAAKDRIPLLTTILADAINLGLSKMAESCPGSSYAKLSWLQAWHIRDDTYSAALAELVNAQFQQPFADKWGDGTTSSSDGQRFKAGGRAESTGHINPKYGAEPGKLFYTHISDQYAPFSSQVVNVGVRDSTYVLDGLLHHESDLRIEEHYTDTAGFTDHVFALMHLLGFRFAPRIRDLSDTKLYLPPGKVKYQALRAMTGGTISLKAIRTLERNPPTRYFNQTRHGNGFAHAPEAGKLPSAERPRRCPTRTRAYRTNPVPSRLATERRPATPRSRRSQQRRGAQCPCKSCIPLSPRRDQGPQLRTATLSGKRFDPRHSGNRALEHRLYRKSRSVFLQRRPDHRPRASQIPLSAWVGAHQSHRRLPMEWQAARTGPLQDPSHPKSALAYSIVRFLTPPLHWPKQTSASRNARPPQASRRSKNCLLEIQPNAKGGSDMTQFGRALAELNIEIICANSSQAKGRVERANRTLQDRLVKELRLENVSDMYAWRSLFT